MSISKFRLVAAAAIAGSMVWALYPYLTSYVSTQAVVNAPLNTVLSPIRGRITRRSALDREPGTFCDVGRTAEVRFVRGKGHGIGEQVAAAGIGSLALLSGLVAGAAIDEPAPAGGR